MRRSKIKKNKRVAKYPTLSKQNDKNMKKMNIEKQKPMSVHIVITLVNGLVLVEGISETEVNTETDPNTTQKTRSHFRSRGSRDSSGKNRR